VLPDIPRDKADHVPSMIGFQSHHIRKGEHAHQVQQRPGIQRKTDFLQVPQLAQVAPAGWLNRYRFGTYFSIPLRKLPSMLLNSIGKIYFVDGEAPIAFRVSKYCSVIVFWSTVCALE
jgi:hypothetical protein